MQSGLERREAIAAAADTAPARESHDQEVSPEQAVRLVRQTRRIDGWLAPGAVYLFALTDRVQKQHGIVGNLFEIGVHHGKSAMVLGAMARASERLGVCDIFGNQAL